MRASYLQWYRLILRSKAFYSVYFFTRRITGSSARRDGHRVARLMFDVLDEEEALAQFFLADQVR